MRCFPEPLLIPDPTGCGVCVLGEKERESESQRDGVRGTTVY